MTFRKRLLNGLVIGYALILAAFASFELRNTNAGLGAAYQPTQGEEMQLEENIGRTGAGSRD